MLNRNKLLTFIFTLLWLSNVAQGDSSKCRSMEDVVKQTIAALNSDSSEMFMELYDTAAVRSILLAEGAQDTVPMGIVGTLEEKINLLSVGHRISFGMLSENVKVTMNTTNPQLEYDHYKITKTKQDVLQHHFVKVSAIAQGKKYSFIMEITSYNGCHYIVLPLDEDSFWED